MVFLIFYNFVLPAYSFCFYISCLYVSLRALYVGEISHVVYHSTEYGWNTAGLQIDQ